VITQFQEAGLLTRPSKAVVPDDVLLERGALFVRKRWGVPFTMPVISTRQFSEHFAKLSSSKAAYNVLFIGPTDHKDLMAAIRAMKPHWVEIAPDEWAST
jgi:hypothetical protein